ncbi:MAG TPA: outer membrane lipoprotein carrier protein LolA [Sporosarcina sp.]|nr:outer membrane lipoprotein carrier protein LolA [Sporosarcina sp.]
MRSRLLAFLVIALTLALAACGAPSKEEVMKKLSGKWTDSKGYELKATMEIKTGAEPRLYNVDVWHTKPDFYRVSVSQDGEGDAQMIVRNQEGVFVVTPSLGKTYKFQSDWPAQNSQAYLIGALSEDIKADKKAVMTENDKSYVFKTATRNNHKNVLPTQEIHIDKKTLLPTHVSVMNENNEEKIRITFKKITLGTDRKPSDYAVERDSQDMDSGEKPDVADEKTGLRVYYPSLNWEGVTLVDEVNVKTNEGTRAFLTYGGKKDFVIVQEPSLPTPPKMHVSVEGDPVDLGFTVAALTDKSIRWEYGGVSFFLASETLTKDEMIQVASSMVAPEMK